MLNNLYKIFSPGYLILSIFLALVQISGCQKKTWRDVKLCVMDTVRECHEMCLREMPSSTTNETRVSVYECQRHHAKMALFVHELCPARYNFHVTNSTPCWTTVPSAVRRDFYEELLVKLPAVQVGGYGSCMAKCWHTVRYNHFDVCQLSCQVLNDATKEHAIQMCIGAFDQTELSDFAFIASEAGKCLRSALDHLN